MKIDGDKYSLSISNAQESDSGEYKITAASSGGLLSCTASLLVTSKPNTHSSSIVNSLRLSNPERPDCPHF